MNLYYSKENLYDKIAKIKEYLGLYRNAYGFDLVDYYIDNGNLIESVPFKTHGLRGMAIIADERKKDIILLNSNRSKCEQNFDCGHEIIHLFLHRTIGQKSFNCFEQLQETQNPIIEWHANEGAAEFFVPYKIFLPLVKEKINDLPNSNSLKLTILYMANIFNVPETVYVYV